MDEAVASIAAEAPQGYFETLPARVRSRLEPKAATRRVPVWTWAAAAALLLAVVTPLTLLRRPEVGLQHASRGRSPPRPRPSSPSPRPRPKPGRPSRAGRS